MIDVSQNVRYSRLVVQSKYSSERENNVKTFGFLKLLHNTFVFGSCFLWQSSSPLISVKDKPIHFNEMWHVFAYKFMYTCALFAGLLCCLTTSQSLLSNYLTIKIVNEHLRPDFIAPDLPAKLSQTVICVITFVKIHINWLNKIKPNGFTSYFVIVSRRVCVLTYFVYFIVHNLNLAMKWLMIPSQSIYINVR